MTDTDPSKRGLAVLLGCAARSRHQSRNTHGDRAPWLQLRPGGTQDA